ncbi:MAG: F0F1 ATP synthase subunit A [Eubacterium sp.]|jgi:F-type H+-transporting ATPase subunit a|nr:F0F1 ATP synthase subunit A [Eubacterium sp.]
MSIVSLTGETAKNFEVNGAMVSFEINIGGNVFYVTEIVFVQLFVTLIIGILFFILGRNLKIKPESKRQVIAEAAVNFFNNTVRDAMGVKYKKYNYYIAAILCMSLLGSLMGLLGLKAPTSNLSVIGTWGVLTFILITRNKFKTGGVKGWLKSFVDPIPFMLPFNIVGEFANPLSQTVRHFANIMAGSVIGGLIYFSLSQIGYGLGAIGVPAVLSLYFDIFSAVVQAYIFAMLTMIYVSSAETGEE